MPQRNQPPTENGHGPNGHHHHAEAVLTPADVTADALRQFTFGGPRYNIALVFFGALLAFGVLGVIARLVEGYQHRANWAYPVAAFAFLLSTTQAAPIVAYGLRFAKAHWRRPLTRAAELHAVSGLLLFLFFLPLLPTLPPLRGRSNIWFNWPVGAPHLWELVFLAVLVSAGLAVLYFSARPDWAAALRLRTNDGRAAMGARFAQDWVGSQQQWRATWQGMLYLGALYVITFAGVHLIFSTDFSMSQIPGWFSSIFPAWHTLGALQAGLATTILTLGILRTLGGMRSYLQLDQFWGLAKILLALSLLWFYMFWADFLTQWYGRTPREAAVLTLLVWGPYAVPFLLAFLGSFLLPFLLLIWSPIRVSIVGPTLVALIVLIGNFFDRVRLYVSAYSLESVTGHQIEKIPATHLPDFIDVMIVLGSIGGAIFCYLLALKFVPVLNTWEVKEGLYLRVVRPFLRTRVPIIGKPV